MCGLNQPSPPLSPLHFRMTKNPALIRVKNFNYVQGFCFYFLDYKNKFYTFQLTTGFSIYMWTHSFILTCSHNRYPTHFKTAFKYYYTYLLNYETLFLVNWLTNGKSSKFEVQNKNVRRRCILLVWQVTIWFFANFGLVAAWFFAETPIWVCFDRCKPKNWWENTNHCPCD